MTFTSYIPAAFFLAGLCIVPVTADDIAEARNYSIDDLQEIQTAPQDGQLPVIEITGEEPDIESGSSPTTGSTLAMVSNEKISTPLLRRRKEAQEKIRRYQAVIDELEYEYGPYHQLLEEALVNLASAYEEVGDHQGSYDLYDRALHATRINAGLHSMEQIPVLKRLIDSLIRIGDVETAVEKQRYFYWLYQRATNSGIDLVPVYSEMVDWHYQAYLNDLGETPTDHLLDAYTLSRRSVSLARSTYGIYSMEMARLLEAQNVLDYEFFDRQMPIRVAALRGYDRGVPERALGGRQQSVNYGNYNQQRGFRGEGFVQRISDRNRLILGAAFSEFGEDSVEYYTSLVSGIDWLLLLGDPKRANEEYEDVYQRLASMEELAEYHETLFLNIRRLPVMYNREFDRQEETEYTAELPADPGMPYLQVLFSVTLRGEVRDIRMASTNLAEPDTLYKAVRREMSSARYRPVIRDGKMSESIDESRVVTFPGLNVELISETDINYAGSINVPGNTLEWEESPEIRDDASVTSGSHTEGEADLSGTPVEAAPEKAEG
jgi:hypothetical protein